MIYGRIHSRVDLVKDPGHLIGKLLIEAENPENPPLPLEANNVQRNAAVKLLESLFVGCEKRIDEIFFAHTVKDIIISLC